ncbi:hypothetical protein Pcinc_006825 [Petrolisthes cinctipes]|uniref:Uncharacterized protein n=1 Tax=Petrolisthes cinctipes TaxID=88211 RepID=A0AAE1GA07_PETCI|nr:hypothetical protein Pcinc_006825 [Petrolisthes cinctipes]
MSPDSGMVRYWEIHLDTLLPQLAHSSSQFVVECEAVGVPGPSISWLLNGVEYQGLVSGGHWKVEGRGAGDQEGRKNLHPCLAEHEGSCSHQSQSSSGDHKLDQVKQQYWS